jgi:hypothetical protein
MNRRLPGLAGLVLLVLAGCAAEQPAAPELPLPPVPPARVPPAPPRAAVTPPATAEGEAEAMPEAMPETMPEAGPPPVWRVARDGTLGCAEPAPLRLVRGGEEAAPRLLAEARVAGGCRTTFRRNQWALEAAEDDLVRLRLLNGQELSLWFLRVDVVPPA